MKFLVPGVVKKENMPTNEFIVERDVMIEMSDGTLLSTNIYRPSLNGTPLPGKFPTVFHRTPYDKNAVERKWGYSQWFAERGYVAIMQDVRGTFASEGSLKFLAGEGPDGADTLKWIDNQEWSDGQVAAWGTSYSSFTQMAMASFGPANLKAFVPHQSATNSWKSSMRQGGAFELRWLGWAFWHSATNARRDLLEQPGLMAALNFGAPTTRDWLTRLPLRKGATQLSLIPEYEEWALKIATESDYSDYWKQPGYAPELYFNKFPSSDILLIGGWYDSYPRSVFEAYVGLRDQGKNRLKLVVGPWVHGTGMPENRSAGNVEYGENSAIEDLRELHQQWFDASLRGINPEIFSSDPISVFVMGGGEGTRTADGKLLHGGYWKHSKTWPLSNTVFTNLYIHEDGTLTPASPKEVDSKTEYRFDPGRPVPTIGGSISSLSDLLPMPAGITDTNSAGGSFRYQDITPAGGFNQVETSSIFGCTPPYLPLASRKDVLVFRTPELEEAVEVIGPIEVRLWVKTSAVDTDFTAKLIDEYPASPSYPHGYALNLTDSIVRLRYRDSEVEKFVTPGECVPVTITLFPTANLFAKGHRIRLDISSSNFPRFDVNTNTGEPAGMERSAAIAINTIFHDQAHPSHIVLPITSAPLKATL
jgi:putative CocE/NonD family hydrolase